MTRLTLPEFIDAHGPSTDDFISAVRSAESDALAAHESGTCSESAWSCSWCEAES